MPIILPSTFADEIEKPHGAQPLLKMVELQVARPYDAGGGTIVPGVILRATSYHQDVAWPPSHPESWTWSPINFGFSGIEETSEGDLPQCELSIDNTTRTLMRFLHQGQGLEGNYCHLYIVPAAALSIAYPAHEYRRWSFVVGGAYATDEAVSFRLERPNWYERGIPTDPYVAGSCRWQFGGEECGYVINDVAAYTACPKTLAACEARGQDHASRGLPVLHPARFGGFPGIPRQR